MRKHSFLSVILFIIILGSVAPANARSVSHSSKLPTPCISTGPEVYLVIDGMRRHIVDWDTFLNLGYQSSDIVPCGAASGFAEGAPITRLFKGSDDAIYLLQNGVRRHIPDMLTFSTMGFQVSDVTILPDNVIALWSLGKPLDTSTIAFNGNVYKELKVGAYTIQLWHPAQSGMGLADFATFKTPDGSTIEIPQVTSIGQLPATDINGDGASDVLFATRGLSGWGTTVYTFDSNPRAILSIESMPSFGPETGQGTFVDLNHDGVYEFLTHDALPGSGCAQATVTVVLKYNAADRRYEGASSEFPDYYADSLAKFTAQAKGGTLCDVYPLISTLLYLNKTTDARAAYDRWYRGHPAYDLIVNATKNGRFYVSGDEGF